MRVDTTTLPTGLSNSVDPDGGPTAVRLVTLGAGDIDLDQDFGYEPTGGANPRQHRRPGLGRHAMPTAV